MSLLFCGWNHLEQTLVVQGGLDTNGYSHSGHRVKDLKSMYTKLRCRSCGRLELFC